MFDRFSARDAKCVWTTLGNFIILQRHLVTHFFAMYKDRREAHYAASAAGI